MKLTTQIAFALLAVATLSVDVRAQGTDFSKIEIITTKIAPNLYILSGSAGVDQNHQDAAGGRIGVLAGPDGIFMIDAQYTQLSDKVLAAIKQISSGPIRFMANTHIHIDHTGGDPFFDGAVKPVWLAHDDRTSATGAILPAWSRGGVVAGYERRVWKRGAG